MPTSDAWERFWERYKLVFVGTLWITGVPAIMMVGRLLERATGIWSISLLSGPALLAFTLFVGREIVS